MISVLSFLTACGLCEEEEVLEPRYDKGECNDVPRNYGYSGFLYADCKVSFTNVLDPAEWTAKIAAGEIGASPGCASLEFGDANDLIAGTDGCGNNVIDCTEQPFTFETYQSHEDYKDEDWFYNFDKKSSRKRLIPIDCNGRLIFDEATTAAIKASLNGDGGAVPANGIGWVWEKTGRAKWVAGDNGKGKRGKWTFSGQFNTNCVMRSCEIPGLDVVLQENA